MSKSVPRKDKLENYVIAKVLKEQKLKSKSGKVK